MPTSQMHLLWKKLGFSNKSSACSPQQCQSQRLRAKCESSALPMQTKSTFGCQTHSTVISQTTLLILNHTDEHSNELSDILGIQQEVDTRRPFMETYPIYTAIKKKYHRQSLWLCAGLQTLWYLQRNFNYGKMHCQALIQTLNYQCLTTTYCWRKL